ncbi:hypothetical protein WAI453_003208 [Rhynchosporium graminicola]
MTLFWDAKNEGWSLLKRFFTCCEASTGVLRYFHGNGLSSSPRRRKEMLTNGQYSFARLPIFVSTQISKRASIAAASTLVNQIPHHSSRCKNPQCTQLSHSFLVSQERRHPALQLIPIQIEEGWRRSSHFSLAH